MSTTNFGMPENSFFTLGGYEKNGNLVGEVNYAGDTAIPAKGEKTSAVITTPEGMSDSQFVSKILEVYGRRDDTQKYDKMAEDGKNCNNFTTSLIKGAYGILPTDLDPFGLNPGLGEIIPGMMDVLNNGKHDRDEQAQAEARKRQEEQNKNRETAADI